MRFLAVLSLLLGVALSTDPELWKQDVVHNFDEIDHVVVFENWKQEFGKIYSNIQEEGYRFMQWLDNWKFINDHNQVGFNYTLGLNQFGDLSLDEFRYHVHGHTGSCMQKYPFTNWSPYKLNLPVKSHSANPTSIDWTNYNGKSYVTPVKNQGQCGSCWAFSATGSLESRHAIATQTTGSSITSLSEQELVDCSTAEGNQGCNGGLMDNAFKYVEKANGLCSEQEYPYTARDGKCKASTCGTHYDPISTYTDVTHDNEADLETAVAMGPVSVAVDAAGSAWQHYKSGIVDGYCGVLLDHGVLAVGYGADSQGEKYWKVKNSWGTSWGMQGYILICKDCNKNGNQGECGINKEPSYPVPSA